MTTRQKIGWIWALPTTAIGFLLFYLGGAKPYARRPAGVLEFKSGGLWAMWMSYAGMAGITIGAVCCVTPPFLDNLITIRHEREHTYQAFALGFLFIPVYYLLCLYGWICGRPAYQANPLEVAAYSHQTEVDG